MSKRRWLLTMSSASTSLLMRSTPSSALLTWSFCSKRKGMVTMPTVRMPLAMASRAMTGAAPVPVPPPMPAVMNTMLRSSSRASRMASTFSSANSRPRSGRPPAPSPGPSCTCSGTSEAASALASVLQTRKRTPSTFSRYMLLTALPPPPPTPMTLMTATGASGFSEGVSSTMGSKCFFSLVWEALSDMVLGLFRIGGGCWGWGE